MKFAGTFTALVTPFSAGQVDLDSLRALVQYQVQGGISGLVVNGTTAESPTLSQDEVATIFKVVREETEGKIPLLLGTGSNSTALTVKKTQQAENWGADGALVVVPYYNKPTQMGLLQHFLAVANATSIPIMLYNVPGRTITGLEIETLKELSAHENIIGVKDATADLELAQKILQQCRQTWTLSSGDDFTCMELCRLGGHGVISVVSNLLPREVTQWIERSRNQDSKVTEEYAQYADFLNLLYAEPNPTPIKAALALKGIIASPELRLPLLMATPALQDKLTSHMQGLGIL